MSAFGSEDTDDAKISSAAMRIPLKSFDSDGLCRRRPSSKILSEELLNTVLHRILYARNKEKPSAARLRHRSRACYTPGGAWLLPPKSSESTCTLQKHQVEIIPENFIRRCTLRHSPHGTRSCVARHGARRRRTTPQAPKKWYFPGCGDQ